MGSPWKCVENPWKIYGISMKTPQTLNPKQGSDMEGIAKIVFCGNRFSCIWELIFVVLWKPWEVVLSIIDSKFRCSRLPKRGSDMEGIAKISFWWKSFLMQFGIGFCCFLEALRVSFIDYWFEISMFGASQTRFWHGRYCKNRLLMEIVFNAFWDWFLLFFGSLGS